MYILHYTWPKVMSAKQDESKEPEEPGVPRCAHMCRGCTTVCPHVPRLCHGCTTYVPRLYPWCSWQEMCQEGKRGSCSVLLLAQHTRLSPQKSTQLEKPKTTANNSRGKTTKTHTPPRNLKERQKNKRTVISKQVYRQKEIDRIYQIRKSEFQPKEYPW